MPSIENFENMLVLNPDLYLNEERSRKTALVLFQSLSWWVWSINLLVGRLGELLLLTIRCSIQYNLVQNCCQNSRTRFQACAYILKTMLAKREKELAIFCPALMVSYNYMSMDAAWFCSRTGRHELPKGKICYITYPRTNIFKYKMTFLFHYGSRKVGTWWIHDSQLDYREFLHVFLDRDRDYYYLETFCFFKKDTEANFMLIRMYPFHWV